MAPVLFRHPSSLRHDTGSHPERAARITAVETALAARDWCGYDVRESPQATTEQLQAVHPAVHVERIRALAAAGGGSIDADTIVSAGSWEAALHAAGGAVAVVDALLDGGAGRAASLHRPPGHHCETAQPMGFCLFNNVAVAARHALDAHGLRRVLVYDWDVHHGNGTAEIFAGTDEVLFCSVHEFPLYPGTGRPNEVGHGAGKGFTVNLPVPEGSGDDVWIGMTEQIVLPIARSYAPELILVSAGYDAHVEDPLAGCTVTDAGFERVAHAVHRVGDELGVPVGLVLEGGYAPDALARSVAATLAAWAGPSRPVREGVVSGAPIVERARASLAGRWPGVALGA
ncbi:histone deacetylase [Patulibacter sp. SYSU D01012]|uniref:histone deacetylase family protein n=1 Tax=Patulibacter sp. SYSU D01012 TaxID=2817381 RepID=UPI0032C151AF